MAHPDDIAQASQALRRSIGRRQGADEEPGSAFAMALAEILAEALSGPYQAQMAAELTVGLRRHRCAYSIGRRPGAQRR